MGKILVVLLGLGVTSFAAFYFLKTQAAASADQRSAPKQQLDNVREKAKSIEDDAQRRADGLMNKATPE